MYSRSKKGSGKAPPYDLLASEMTIDLKPLQYTQLLPFNR